MAYTLLNSTPQTSGSAESGKPPYPTLGYAIMRYWSTLVRVQKLFSMFPPGWPGIGLLLLRFSVAIALLVDAYAHRALPGWAHGATGVIAISLFTGYLTPIAAALGLLLHFLVWARLGNSSTALAVVVSLEIAALALLGPGGYSFDAYRFGRRIVVLPPS